MLALRETRIRFTFYSKKDDLLNLCPTKRAADVWDSARFTGIFLASSFSCSQTESKPTHTQLTQTVGLDLNPILRQQLASAEGVEPLGDEFPKDPLARAIPPFQKHAPAYHSVASTRKRVF